MNYGSCHRCHAELPTHDDGELIYCSRCGAPQVLLSEELLERMETQSIPMQPVAARAEDADVWRGAIRIAALAGAVTVVLMVASLAVPMLSLLSFLWILASPVVVVGFFHARYPAFRITTGFGARLGLLTGLSIAAAMVALDTVQLLAVRFSGQIAGDPSRDMAGVMIEQLKVAAAARPDPGMTAFINQLNIPEFRAGFLLTLLAMVVVFLLITTTVGGAFAGFARSRQRAA